jgi:hypothetical protein
MSPINVISGRTPGRRSRASIHIDIGQLTCKYVASAVVRKDGAVAITLGD